MKAMSTDLNCYMLACSRPWGLEAFAGRRTRLPGQWLTVTSKDDLSPKLLEAFKPRYIFFPHWSWLVPDNIIQQFECVCFHMTDVPFGRGGTPLQNLISRGFENTKLTALRMTSELDAGPVYDRRSLELYGAAQDIFRRAMDLSLDLMEWIVETEPDPKPQSGEALVFPRRRPEQSALPETGTIEALYDHIRMLDAQGYPHAFLNHGGWHFSFTGAELGRDHLLAQVRISKKRHKGTK